MSSTFLRSRPLRRGPVEERLVGSARFVPLLPWIAVNTSGDSLRPRPAPRACSRSCRGSPSAAGTTTGTRRNCDVGRQLRLSHACRMRLEVGAMRAAVREELDDLDLLAGLDRHRRLEAHVVLAFDHLRRRRATRARARRERSARQRAARAGSIGHRRALHMDGSTAGRTPQRADHAASWAGDAPASSASARRPALRYLITADVEAALRELGLDAVELVGVVVGPEAHAVARPPCRAACPAGRRPPSRPARAAPSGSPHRPALRERSRLQPEAVAGFARLWRLVAARPCRGVRGLAARRGPRPPSAGGPFAPPCRPARDRARRRRLVGWIFGSSPPGRIL